MNDWLLYCSSRFPLRRYFPLALLLCTAANIASPSVGPTQLCVDFILACSLLFQFRLWDDLSDLQQDRVEHPERVLSLATSLLHFRSLLAISLLLNVGIFALMKPISSLLVCLSLNAALFVSYKLRDALQLPYRFFYHVVLLKYPVFVYLLSQPEIGGDWVLLGYAMAAIYFSFCVFEILHDKRLHVGRCATTMLGLETMTLGTIATLMLVRMPNAGGWVSILQGSILTTTYMALAMIFQRHRQRIAPGLWCYTVFLLCFLWLLECVMIQSEIFNNMNDMWAPQ